ncbi:CPBP family intramembrane metalloprotease [Aquimarina algiphila]|uniref:CPBP family intramembrane metalloprotease n=2 Tax=Aquimarina algiphila TaxID=2047982 RepID=A0A554VE89_9FLAO|nr:CPBP family intramembrane metalloprotease [Aquimarina algiphila]
MVLKAMNSLFYGDDNRFRAPWRILLFSILLLLSVLPLIWVKNSVLQFFGAVVILIVGLYLNAKYLDKRNFSEYGIVFKKNTIIYFLTGIIIGITSVAILLGIGSLIGALSITEFSTRLNIVALLFFGVKMFFVSIWEETFFRGYLFTNFNEGFQSSILSKNQSLIVALLLSSVLFGLAHFNNGNASFLSIFYLSINGIVWCVPFIITKNLGLSIGLHMSWNFAQSKLFGFTMSGNRSEESFIKIKNIGTDLWTGGEYGPEAGLLGLIGFALMLVLSLMYLKINRIKII